MKATINVVAGLIAYISGVGLWAGGVTLAGGLVASVISLTPLLEFGTALNILGAGAAVFAISLVSLLVSVFALSMNE